MYGPWSCRSTGVFPLAGGLLRSVAARALATSLTLLVLLAHAILAHIVLAHVLLAPVLLVPAHARPLDDVRTSGVLRVIVYDDNAPFSWTEPDGTVKGIDADVARAVAVHMGLKADVIARSAGEEADDDLRSNIWQGPRTGGVVGDVMMHVPMEKEFIVRNNLTMISNAYLQEEVVLAVHPDMVDPAAGLDPFKRAKLAVHFATTAHYFVMFADGGAYKNSVNPYKTFQSAVDSFVARQNAGLLGRRAQIEAALGDAKAGVVISKPSFDTHLRMSWTIGTAVKHDSRDTAYAFGNALSALIATGEIDAIFARYGVTRVPPPTP